MYNLYLSCTSCCHWLQCISCKEGQAALVKTIQLYRTLDSETVPRCISPSQNIINLSLSIYSMPNDLKHLIFTPLLKQS